NNNQLTLIGFTIKKVGPILPRRQDGNDEEIQKYYFTYTKNPHIDLEKISTWVAASGNDEWPGYYTENYLPNLANTNLSSAWRLKTVILPTGGKYTFDYEKIEKVRYDPEGAYNDEYDYGWQYSSEPVCRLKSKKFEDGFDGTRTWNYTYSDSVVFDPPAYVYQSNYVPKMYRIGYINREDQYYKWIRACTIGHRWVKVSN